MTNEKTTDSAASALSDGLGSHTAGPWRVVRQNPSPTTGEWMISGSRPGYLAEVRDCGSGDVAANAKLIAAAPDLMLALQYAIDQVPELATVPGIAAAMARAKG